MKIPAVVISEVTRLTKSGLNMTTLDLGVPGVRGSFELLLGKDDDDLRGTLQGRSIVLEVREMQPGFRGQGVRIFGNIVREKTAAK